MTKKFLLFVGMLSITLSFVSAATFTNNLNLGARGEEVKKLQQFLIDKGFLNSSVSGYYGVLTQNAVKAFQKQNNLPQTGAWFTLTQQKASQADVSTISDGKNPQSASTTTSSTSSKQVVKNVELTISNTSGGGVFITGTQISCYSFETCTKTIKAGKTTLKAVPHMGYLFDGWSDVSCGTKPECTLTLAENTTIYARFKVIPTYKRTGKIYFPTPSYECHIGLAQEKCSVPVYWTNDTGLDMTLSVDGAEYAINVQSDTSPLAKYPINPDLVIKDEPKNTIGPVYFQVTPGETTFSLKSGGQVLDSVTIRAVCAEGSYHRYGRYCWRDDAKRLSVFKQEGFLIKSDIEGVSCGYREEVCLSAFPQNTKVTLTVTPLPGYKFEGWTGDCSGDSLTCTLMLDQDKYAGVKKRIVY